MTISGRGSDYIDVLQRDYFKLSRQPTNLSKKYASPNKFFEYMMAGIPIICSNLPVMKSIIDEFKNGLVLKDHQPKTIAETIQQLFATSEYNKMAANSLKAAHQRYNWQNESKKMIELYKRLWLEIKLDNSFGNI